MGEENKPRRPVPLEPRDMDTHAASLDPAEVSRVAHESAAALVGAAREGDDPQVAARLVNLVDELGLSAIAELWSQQSAHSLPGALWRMYVIREWLRRSRVEVSADYDAGRLHAQVEHAIAGAVDPTGPAEIQRLADELLTGVIQGDLAVALERAAAFCRVVSVGQAYRADAVDNLDEAQAAGLTRRAGSLLTTADDLTRCAHLWRAGKLT